MIFIHLFMELFQSLDFDEFDFYGLILYFQTFYMSFYFILT